MKSYDDIEKLKEQTYRLHNLETGVMDMTLGIIFLISGFGFGKQNPGMLWIFVFTSIMLSRALKKKFVYPRVGIAVFTDTTKQDPKINMKFILIFLFMGLIGFLLFGLTKKHIELTNPLVCILGVLISGMYILGGVSQKQIFYMIGLALVMPIIGIQFSQGIWLSLGLIVAVFVAFLALFLWMHSKQKLMTLKGSTHRPTFIIHCFLLAAGVLGMAYFVIVACIPELAATANHWVSTHQGFFFGNALALLMLGMGLSYREPRLCLYAIMISLCVFATKFYDTHTISIEKFSAGMGALMLIAGIILFISFLKRYPILEEKSDEVNL